MASIQRCRKPEKSSRNPGNHWKNSDKLWANVGDTARKAAWQFLHKTRDARLSMLRRFAKAVGVSIEELVAEGKKKGQPVVAGP